MNGKNKIENYKVYVFFHRTITNVGGGEIYLRNKINYLKNQGYKIVVFSTDYGKIYINELKEFEKFIIPELYFNPFLLNYKKRNKIIKEIIGLLYNMGSSFFIESNSYPLCLWGEIIAKTVSSPNFVFLVDDNFKKFENNDLLYFKFKHTRKELAGISPKSLFLLFNSFYNITKGTNYHLSFFCNNSIEDIKECGLINNMNYDIKIGTISRLDKPSVLNICNEIIIFANKNYDKKILYTIFGGSESKIIYNEIKNKFRNSNNIDFIITDYIYPIPLIDIKKFDLFISLAGAAKATFNQKIPTLSINVLTNEPLGILGYNTFDTQYATLPNYLWQNIHSVLEDFFIHKKINKEDIIFNQNTPCSNPNFDEHISFVNDTFKNYTLMHYDFKDYVYPFSFDFLVLRFISYFPKKIVFYILIKLRHLKYFFKKIKNYIRGKK